MNLLQARQRSSMRNRILASACFVAMGLVALPAMASTFRLQSTTVVMDERDGRTAFNVTNTGEEPILLLSKLDDLSDQPMAKNILVTPAVTRIDPGQTQIINFSLKKGANLDHEYLLKASFEGVTQSFDHGTRMPIRQEIGFIAQPKAIPVDPTPWKELRIEGKGNQITLTNPGKHIVRLGPVVTLQPSGVQLPLAHAYIMPGQSVNVSHDSAASVGQISITPLSRYGLAQTAASLPVTR
jgi:fimbrial chaperone protein